MRALADGLWLLDGRPRYAVNVYLVGDVLLDAGTQLAARRILRQLQGRTVRAHALTHAHPDHFGSSARVCGALGLPLWCGQADVAAVETGAIVPGRTRVGRLVSRMPAPPTRRVDRRLSEGDDVAGFRVLETPGHSPGHLALWRESDRVLVAGDVLFNLRLVRARPGLREPPAAVTPDPARNRDSARRLAALSPALMCFGHGPPLRDPERIAAFVRTLPA